MVIGSFGYTCRSGRLFPYVDGDELSVFGGSVADIDLRLTLLCLFVIMILNFSVLVYIAHRHAEYIESLMEDVFLDQGENLFFGFGLVGKVMYTGVVAGVLTVPKLYALRGAMDTAALRKFPAGMRWV